MSMIFVANPVSEAVLERLRAHHEVVVGYGPDRRGWADVISDVEAVMIRTDQVSADLIAKAPKLRIIARHGVGTDNVDLNAAKAAGIWVTTTPGANSQSVAEHVFALLLTLCRSIAQASTAVANGQWSERRKDFVGTELSGKELLLIGGGGIAKNVIPIAHGFGMKVSITDPALTARAIESIGAIPTNLSSGLSNCDVVSIHVPLLPSTRHLLDSANLDLLKPSAFVINTSRGGVIDEHALIERLTDGRLAGAGLDVLEGETVSMNDPLTHTHHGFDLPNLIVTPHIAGQTTESLRAVGTLAAESIEQALNGSRPDNALFDISELKGH